MSQTTQCLPNCLVKSSRNDSGPCLVQFHHIWLVDRDVCCARGALLSGSSPCVWWDTAWNKEPVVWSWCGVTLIQSSPETLHPWLQVTAPAERIPVGCTGILWLYQGKNLNFVNGNACRWWHVPTQLHRLFTFFRPARPLITNNHIYTWTIRWCIVYSHNTKSMMKVLFSN